MVFLQGPFDICLAKQNAMIALITSIIIALSPNYTGTPDKVYKTDAAKSTMTIIGTSTLHDWEMNAENFKGVMDVYRYDDSLDIQDLQLSIPVKSLKSGKSAMDKNAYEALKADDHEMITYELKEIVSQSPKPDGIKLITLGQLTVAGKTRTMRIPITAVYNKGEIALKGSTTFTMSSFGVEPPSFMFGSVTTGDEITINFSINYN